jgi:hypothetical protein
MFIYMLQCSCGTGWRHGLIGLNRGFVPKTLKNLPNITAGTSDLLFLLDYDSLNSNFVILKIHVEKISR